MAKYLSKCIKLYFFPEKNIYVATLPKIIRPVARNTLIFFLFGLGMVLEVDIVSLPTKVF